MKKLEQTDFVPAPRERHLQTPADAARTLAAAASRISARRARDALPVRLESRRLVLRAPIRGDVPDLVRLADNRAVARFLSRLPSPYTRADAIGFVEIQAQRADERPYAITLDGALIGIVGFTFAPDQPPELGYWLGEPHWGNGYMTEAVRALLDAAFATRLYPRVGAKALAANIASLRVLEKSAFQRTGMGVEERGPSAGDPLVLLLREQPRWM
ncbi:MAG TPA: GNAT family N-acetyltransferase [Devosiaceae bacterium]|jgi:RimJ/RimL family protein N-acetyltransferase|nr:GNAT family N-acetyltransferase [Devosiaceae bacterium]